MQIIEKLEHPKHYTIADLENGEIFRLPTTGAIYIKIGALDTEYNSVDLAKGDLCIISEDYEGLIKVKGAFVENYKSDDDIDFMYNQLAAKQEQCKQFWDANQNLKENFWQLEHQLEDQEKHLIENQKRINELKAEQVRLQFRCDASQTKYFEMEKAYKNLANDSDTLLKQIIDAAYLGEMKGLEAAIIENPQRLIDKIRSLANTIKQLNNKDTSD